MELDDLEDPTKSHGMECVVTAVWDITTKDGKRGIEIMGDYGMGYTIWDHDQDDWHFAIFDNGENLNDVAKWQHIPQTFNTARRLNGS